MAYNTYDLDKPGQDYNAIHAKIKSLGTWYHPRGGLGRPYQSVQTFELSEALMSMKSRCIISVHFTKCLTGRLPMCLHLFRDRVLTTCLRSVA